VVRKGYICSLFDAVAIAMLADAALLQTPETQSKFRRKKIYHLYKN
jgi:hypothetical protein